MPTPLDEFKQRLAAVLNVLENPERRKSEVMFLIGQMAAHLIDMAELHSWREVKNSLSAEKRDRLLAEFQTEGNRLAREGQHEEAYAIQVLAISVIARTINDPEVTAGEDVLDPVIALATSAYRTAVARFDRAEEAGSGELLD